MKNYLQFGITSILACQNSIICLMIYYDIGKFNSKSRQRANILEKRYWEYVIQVFGAMGYEINYHLSYISD